MRSKPIEFWISLFLPRFCLLKKLPHERIFFSEHTHIISSAVRDFLFCFLDFKLGAFFNILLGCPFKQILFLGGHTPLSVQSRQCCLKNILCRGVRGRRPMYVFNEASMFVQMFCPSLPPSPLLASKQKTYLSLLSSLLSPELQYSTCRYKYLRLKVSLSSKHAFWLSVYYIYYRHTVKGTTNRDYVCPLKVLGLRFTHIFYK